MVVAVDHAPQVPLSFADCSTVYPVIAVPPVSDGGVHVTVACRSPELAESIVGAPGAANAAPVTVLESSKKPKRDVVTVTVADCPVANPDTVTTSSLRDTEPAVVDSTHE
jgi:hypothetical protein